MNQTSRNSSTKDTKGMQKHDAPKTHRPDERDALIKTLQGKVRRTEKKMVDVSLRSRAEIENVKKRCDENTKKIYKFCLERFFVELLPVLDNLERALQTLQKSHKAHDSTAEGIGLTRKCLLSALEKFGVRVVDRSNVPFDPKKHQAVITSDAACAPNTVLKVVQKGYKLHDRLLRPAMVVVSKKPQ